MQSYLEWMPIIEDEQGQGKSLGQVQMSSVKRLCRHMLSLEIMTKKENTKA